jgi:MOSC domain-containing protein
VNQLSAAESGSVVSVWRYPVKSMIGEKLALAHVNQYGLVGDRSYALVDTTDGKTATAKNPRTWPTLFTFKATCIHTVDSHEKIPPVRIILPNGATVTSEQPDLDRSLSQALKREVRLIVVEQGKVKGVQSSLPAAWTGQSDEYWPDIEGRDHQDTTTEFTLPTGTFFDAATVHLLTTATLHQLREHYPSGHFGIERFRPNIVVESLEEKRGFVENSWIGHTIAIGEEVRLTITGPCGRCVMTTLPQGNLPKDPGILRTALQQNHGNVGVYASVLQGGTIRPGDRIRVEP